MASTTSNVRRGGKTPQKPGRSVHRPSGKRVDGCGRASHRNRFLSSVAFDFSFMVEIHAPGFLGSWPVSHSEVVVRRRR